LHAHRGFDGIDCIVLADNVLAQAGGDVGDVYRAAGFQLLGLEFSERKFFGAATGWHEDARNICAECTGRHRFPPQETAADRSTVLPDIEGRDYSVPEELEGDEDDEPPSEGELELEPESPLPELDSPLEELLELSLEVELSFAGAFLPLPA
jgi:hypothetical protein